MPHARIVTSYDLGPEGRILIATLEADPAVGAELLVTVPGRAVWQIMAVRYLFDTDGTAASRRPRLTLDDGSNSFYRVRGGNTTVANSIDTFDHFQGAGVRDELSDEHTLPLPMGLTMLPGWRLRTETLNLQAGDNFGAPVLYVREIPQRGLAVGQDALLSALRRLIGEEAFGG